MSNVLFIVGLPGSGKSTLAKNINKENNNKYRIIDDPKDINEFKPELIISYPNIIFRICQKIYIHKNDPKYLDKEYDYFTSELRQQFLKYNTTKSVAEYFVKDTNVYLND